MYLFSCLFVSFYFSFSICSAFLHSLRTLTIMTIVFLVLFVCLFVCFLLVFFFYYLPIVLDTETRLPEMKTRILGYFVPSHMPSVDGWTSPVWWRTARNLKSIESRQNWWGCANVGQIKRHMQWRHRIFGGSIERTKCVSEGGEIQKCIENDWFL